MKIATFGSCLSRYTANYYIRLYKGELISSVYHNRSDAFIGTCIEKKWKQPDLEHLLANFKQSPDYDPDSLPLNILTNQYIDTVGLHRLKNGLPFLQVLENNLADVIIMDNYLDISAKLIRSSEFDGIFFKVNDLNIDNQDLKPVQNIELNLDSLELEMTELLNIEESILNISKIIDFIHEKSPKTKIIFLNFPHNTYEPNSERVKRIKAFEAGFKHPSAVIVPCLDVHRNFQTSEQQHFKAHQYCAYAGIIWQALR